MPAMPAGDWAAPYATPTRPGLPPATAQRASSPAIGIVALVLAIIAFVVPASIAAGTMARIGAAAAPAFWYSPTMWDWGYLTPVKGEVLTTEIAFWAGTVLGAVAIVLGVTAIARRRGRGFGIAAIVIGVVAFFVFMVVAWVAFIAGTAL